MTYWRRKNIWGWPLTCTHMHTHEGINQVRLCFCTVEKHCWWWSRALMSFRLEKSPGEFRFWCWHGPDVQLWKRFSYTLKGSTSVPCQQEDALGCSRPKTDSGCKGFRSPDCIWLRNHRTSNTSVNSVLFPESEECDLVGNSLLEIRVEVFSVWKGHPDWMAPWETGQN